MENFSQFQGGGNSQNLQKKFECEFAGKKITVEIGKMAAQVNASCLIYCGETVVLATAAIGKEPREGIDFFPLSVEMREKMYAAGKIKGSRFIKREGRPTDNAVLDARMIDRGLRPLFNQELRHEVQVVVVPLSYDENNPADVLGITAASIALHISDIPWNGPLVGVLVGRIDGRLVFNPTLEELEKSDLKLTFSVRQDKIIMIDAEAGEAEESEIAEAFEFGVNQAKPLLEFIDSLRKEVGQPKQDEQKLLAQIVEKKEVSQAEKERIWERAKEFFSTRVADHLFDKPKGTKRERKAVAEKLLKDFFAQEDFPQEVVDYLKLKFEGYLESKVTEAILSEERRIDGRTLEEIRPLQGEVGLLPRTHGSALFNRGETQVLTVVTLGSPGDAQILDEMTEDDTHKRYMHFYYSPPYCFGEPGAFRGVGRREIGHGALAEKAIAPVLPEKEDFPYTILAVSEVMGSNGSSSMASVCGSSLALMDAGVPIKKPVAGIAMGMSSDRDSYKILTDLQDFEDGDGGMDFKLAGTAEGITAIQMDTKTEGLSLEVCRRTLEQGKKARLKILEFLNSVIAQPRAELSPYAPRITTIKIKPEKIKDVIGPAGKIITEITETCKVEIDIENDGLTMITGTDSEGVSKALEWIKNLTKEVQVGEIYTGAVTRTLDFGAFVEILPGREGLVHISEFSSEHVDKISDVAKIGQELTVKVIEIDDQGRINLSVKQANPNYQAGNDSRKHSNYNRRDNRRDDHRDNNRRNNNFRDNNHRFKNKKQQ